MNQPGGASQQWQQPVQQPQQAGGWGAQQPQQPQQPQQGWQQTPQPVQQVKTVPASLGPFTFREWGIILGAVLLFAMSFVPLFFSAYVYTPIWITGFGSWLLAVILPVAAAVLVIVRRLAVPHLRVLGFGVDQIVAVTAIGSLIAWISILFSMVGGVPQWIGTIISLGVIFLTLVAPFVPGLKDDFAERPALPAEAITLGARAIVRVGATPQPYGAQAFGQNATGVAPTFDPNATGVAPTFDPNATANFGAGWAGAQQQAPVAAAEPAQQWAAQAAEPAPQQQWGQQQAAPAAYEAAPAAYEATPAEAPVAEAPVEAAPVEAVAEASAPASDAEPATKTAPFWALSPVERDVVDENGQAIFQVGPTAWALVVEDRGDSFVIRHDDGRTGVLADISGVTRG